MLLYENFDEKRLGHDELQKLSTNYTESHINSPYTLSAFVNGVKEALKKSCLEVADEDYKVSGEFDRIYGLLKIACSEYLTPAKLDNDWALIIVLSASCGETFSAKITIGSQVLICSNLCFHDEILSIENMKNINAPNEMTLLISDALDKIPTRSSDQETRFATFKRTKINKATGDLMLMDIYRKGGLNIQQLGTAIKEWDTPSFDSHSQFDGKNGYSLWRLFNAATQTLKMNQQGENIDIFYHRCHVLNQIVNAFVGLAR